MNGQLTVMLPNLYIVTTIIVLPHPCTYLKWKKKQKLCKQKKKYRRNMAQYLEWLWGKIPLSSVLCSNEIGNWGKCEII